MSQSAPDKRPAFGNRHLSENSDIYQHNAWDNVDWDEEFKNSVIEKIDVNSKQKLSVEKALELDQKSSFYWEQFYDKHDNKFFKDRHWLFTEFPELLPENVSTNEKKVILELGCGVGNTVFPILQIDNSNSLFIFCCDFSDKAIQIIKENKFYNEKFCHAFVFDITSQWNLMPFEPESLDIVTMIFVLSAIDPLCHKNIIQNITRYLKPNGLILFRDYGYCDLTQTRFKAGKCIKDNFYVRGDGTRSYFFKETEIDQLFSECGLIKDSLNVDRRLQVNRANKKKMYRIWIQAKYKKGTDLS